MTVTSVAAALLIAISVFFAMRRFRGGPKEIKEPELIVRSSEAAIQLNKLLASALPEDVVVLPQNAATFKKSMNTYWAQQECEVVPACVVRPRNIDQLCTAVTILKGEYDRRRSLDGEKGGIKAGGLFAVRSGGHSAVSRAASIEDGVMIDMSLFCDVTPSKDGSSVVIGAGARWGPVFEALAAKGLAVAGGRNSHVGVGGLTLGGGISFFSQRVGSVCNNVLSYEVVLASGTVATASPTSNPDLWRALKGGGNNFGILTSITLRSFPSTDIWSGFLYMPSSCAQKALHAFHDFVHRAHPDNTGITYDRHASGPIACFTYLQQLGIQAVSVNLVYTKLPEKKNKWPECWETSGFKPLWRFWSTCKVRPLADACDEMNTLNPPGRRQVLATTTIKNDMATLQAVYAAYKDAITPIKKANIKGMSWTLVLQPMLANWAGDGCDGDPFGLADTKEPLVIVSFTVNWIEKSDDKLSEKLTRDAIEQIDAAAAANGTSHRYRYMNYCGDWQRPFEGYGEENAQLLRNVSKKYDPEGLFQRGCVGGFKLDREYS
ncbi:FAD binding domain-containing protein [Trichophyton tonsurans CBS 112818]|uniref:FAD binding domain-containing protein n=2 Tax=Trichophyton TaxID=5550 RepID=F2PI04_TRIEC|nr:FAD binding domain-containing protein [Trichophyton tonsurans CBS 112818]EGE01566.1 FAD binding domain-containing protein [Trichophyton equinum CBS 127.97]